MENYPNWNIVFLKMSILPNSHVEKVFISCLMATWNPPEREQRERGETLSSRKYFSDLHRDVDIESHELDVFGYLDTCLIWQMLMAEILREYEKMMCDLISVCIVCLGTPGAPGVPGGRAAPRPLCSSNSSLAWARRVTAWVICFFFGYLHYELAIRGQGIKG